MEAHLALKLLDVQYYHAYAAANGICVGIETDVTFVLP